MNYAVMPLADYDAACDKVREKVDLTTPTIKSGELAEKVDEVYESGQKAEHDRFWNIYQQNGNRVDYGRAYAGYGWTDETFYPKYDMVVNDGDLMFHFNEITNLIDKLAECGVTLDFSKVKGLTQGFQGTKIKHLPTLDLRTCTSLLYTFGSQPLTETIDKIILSENTNQDNLGANTFHGANRLKNITFEGVITKSINFSWSPLTVDSMKSVISCLKNYVGTNYEATYKVSFTEACWTALEASGASPSGGTWKEYVEFTLGWST